MDTGRENSWGHQGAQPPGGTPLFVVVDGAYHTEYGVWVLLAVCESGLGPCLLFLDEPQSSKDPGPPPPQLSSGTYSMHLSFFLLLLF